MKHSILTILFFLLFNQSKSCECRQIERDSAVNIGLRNSDIIFLGEVISLDTINHSYRFRILETFKGDNGNETIGGVSVNTCSLFPQDKGLWIIYADKLNDTTIDISNCGPSVSLLRAERLYSPLPKLYDINTPRDSVNDELDYKIKLLEKKTESISLWFHDLEKLRKYKKSNELNRPYRSDKRDIILGLLIGMNLILMILLFYRQRK